MVDGTTLLLADIQRDGILAKLEEKKAKFREEMNDTGNYLVELCIRSLRKELGSGNTTKA